MRLNWSITEKCAKGTSKNCYLFCKGISALSCFFFQLLWQPFIAWKVSKYGVFSGLYFPAFGLNTEKYVVSFRIQYECEKIWTRKNSVFGHFSRSEFFTLHYLSDVHPRLCAFTGLCWLTSISLYLIPNYSASFQLPLKLNKIDFMHLIYCPQTNHVIKSLLNRILYFGNLVMLDERAGNHLHIVVTSWIRQLDFNHWHKPKTVVGL